MNATKKQARIAGFWYLMMAVTGPLGLMYIPTLIAKGDPAATAQNILDAEFLFRMSIVSNFLCQLAFIWLVLALYRLFKDVNKDHARLMVSLVLVSVPISFLNQANLLASLLFLKDADFLTTFSLDERQSMAMAFLRLHEYGVTIAEIFWGLWLFPFGWLAIKSSFLPRVLGVLLLVAGMGYIIHTTAFFLFPDAADAVNSMVSLPEGIGELAMVAWLLIKGASNQNIIHRTPALAAS